MLIMQKVKFNVIVSSVSLSSETEKHITYQVLPSLNSTCYSNDAVIDLSSGFFFVLKFKLPFSCRHYDFLTVQRYKLTELYIICDIVWAVCFAFCLVQNYSHLVQALEEIIIPTLLNQKVTNENDQKKLIRKITKPYPTTIHYQQRIYSPRNAA